MNTITLVSSDKKVFKISEYQAKLFIFPKYVSLKSKDEINDYISIGCKEEIIKLLLDHAEIYMYRDKEKIYDDLVKYVDRIKNTSKMQRFTLINTAQNLSYEKLNSLVKLIKLC